MSFSCSFDVNMSIIVSFSLIVPCLEEFMLLVASQVNYLKECTITACTLLIFSVEVISDLAVCN